VLNSFSINFLNNTITIFITVTMVTVTMPAFTQVSSNEINYFSRCRNIIDNNARAICYDDLYDRAVHAVTPRKDADRLMEENRRIREELVRIRQQTGSTSASGQAAESDHRVPSPARGNIEEFGKKEPYVVNNEDGERVLYDRIEALKKNPDGWIITLESGQIWRQTVSRRYALLEGQEVKITPSKWGSSYRMTVSNLGGFIRVERIK